MAFCRTTLKSCSMETSLLPLLRELLSRAPVNALRLLTLSKPTELADHHHLLDPLLHQLNVRFVRFLGSSCSMLTFSIRTATALAPAATTEYAPLDRPGSTKAATGGSATPAHAQDGTPAPPATGAEGSTPAPVLIDAEGSATPAPAPVPVVGLVPHGSLVPLEYAAAQQKPTVDVDLMLKDANGNDLFDLDIDALEEKDKGWRKPGANMADYFNYGMNEASWRNYVGKQKRMRGEESAEANPFAVSFDSPPLRFRVFSLLTSSPPALPPCRIRPLLRATSPKPGARLAPKPKP